MAYLIRQLDIRDKDDAVSEFNKINATKAGIEIMSLKSVNLFLKIRGLNNKAANILKQEMLVRGGDVVLSREAIYKSDGSTDIIIFGTSKNILSLAEKIKMQPFGLKDLALDLIGHLKDKKALSILTISGKKYDLRKRALLMGILNITPDSFYDGGKYMAQSDIKKRAEKIVSEGADIIDVGGMSTRPFSQPVDIIEESERVIPVIKHISKNYDVLISADTYRSEVAARALENGAHIVNDISGLGFDVQMKKVVKQYQASVVIMHIKGTPADMQANPEYEDVISAIYEYFIEKTDSAIEYGINKEKLIIDAGLGFGKTIDHNFEILKHLKDFAFMGFPLMVGASRKSFTGSQFNITSEERLEASLAIASYSLLNGANIIRVHDVSQTLKAMKMIELIKNA